MNDISLRLHHELLLLALADDTGKVAFGSMLNLGLGGALFTELLLEERLEIVGEGRKQLVEVRNGKRLREPVLDMALDKLASAKRRASPSNTVSRLGNLPKLRHEVARELCKAGVLKETEAQVLLFFRARRYPTVDPKPERELIRRIRSAVSARKQPEDRTAALISIANVAGALGAIYDRKERRLLKVRLKEIATHSDGGRAASSASAATAAAISAAQTAIVAATVAAAAAG